MYIPAGRPVHTHTHVYTHMQTPLPAGTLVGPSAHMTQWHRHIPAPPLAPPPGGLRGRTPSWSSACGRMRGEPELAQAGPSTPPLPLPTGLEGEVHPRELHQGPGREDGGDGKDWRPLGNKAAGSGTCCREGDRQQRNKAGWPGRGEGTFLCSGTAWGEGMDSGMGPLLLRALSNWSLQGPGGA